MDPCARLIKIAIVVAQEEIGLIIGKVLGRSATPEELARVATDIADALSWAPAFHLDGSDDDIAAVVRHHFRTGLARAFVPGIQ